MRLLLILSLILSLAGAGLVHAAAHQAVVFVADLSASTFPARTDMAEFIRKAMAAKGPEDLAGAIDVGEDAAIDVPVSKAPRFEQFSAEVHPDHTDLARGLRLAAALLPSGYRPRIVVLSDGRENQGSAQDEVRRLKERGITVDSWPVQVPQGAEALISSFDAPTALREGERLTLTARLTSTTGGDGILRLYDGSKVLEQRPVTLPQGALSVTFVQEKLASGFHNFKLTLEASKDTLPQNNEASLLVEVQGPPRVLLVEGTPGAAANIAVAMRAAGIDTDTNPADAIPERLTSLERYAAVVLADVPAPLIGNDAMKALTLYVREAGRGLVVVGGQNSYAMGGYARTPLEDLMPVSMDIPQKKEKPAVAVVLIIENLESQTKVNISKEAGKGVVGLLGPRDYLAVSDANLGWAVPMRRVGDKDTILKSIDAMSPGDPPTYIPYLEQARQALRDVPTKVKHIILAGDGDAQFSSFADYADEVKKLADDGITLSTVQTNAMQPSEFLLMQQLAQWGNGRYYDANFPGSIPQIFLKEAQLAARPGVIEEHFTPAVVTPSPILQGIKEFPALDGYVATTPKPAAEVVLASPQDDAVLAQWHAGLGRVVAWTSDSQGLWTADMVHWPGFAQWWANVISYVLPAPGEQSLTTRVQRRGSVAHLSVEQNTGASGEDISGLPSLTATVVAPDGSLAQVTLPATAPGQFEGDVSLRRVGSYLVRYTRGEGKEQGILGTAGIVVPYSPEFELAGTDSALLARLATGSGGRVLATPEAAFASDLPPAPGVLPLQRSLLLFALLLWPVDIAVRRLATTPGEVLAALRAWRRRRRKVGRTQSTAAYERVKQRRAARPAAPQAPVTPPAPQPAAPRPAAEKPVPQTPKAEKAAPGGLAEQLLRAKQKGRDVSQ